MRTATINELTELLDLEPGKVKLLELLEERQKEQDKNDQLSKKTTLKQARRKAIIKWLNDLQKDIFISNVERMHYEGLTQREISKVLNASLGSINKILHSNTTRNL